MHAPEGYKGFVLKKARYLSPPPSPSFSWLLRDPDMRLRSAYEPYLTAINRYFTKLFKILVPLQSTYGGPIIAFQIENEFAHHPHTSDLDGQEYMFALYGVSYMYMIV